MGRERGVYFLSYSIKDENVKSAQQTSWVNIINISWKKL